MIQSTSLARQPPRKRLPFVGHTFIEFWKGLTIAKDEWGITGICKPSGGRVTPHELQEQTVWVLSRRY